MIKIRGIRKKKRKRKEKNEEKEKEKNGKIRKNEKKKY